MGELSGGKDRPPPKARSSFYLGDGWASSASMASVRASAFCRYSLNFATIAATMAKSIETLHDLVHAESQRASGERKSLLGKMIMCFGLVLIFLYLSSYPILPDYFWVLFLLPAAVLFSYGLVTHLAGKDEARKADGLARAIYLEFTRP